jgi:UDP-N-acetyl-D-mannosaminuronate dehydrogenase
LARHVRRGATVILESTTYPGTTEELFGPLLEEGSGLVVELANDVNDHMPDYVVRRLILALNREGKALSGSRILLLGLAYKKNTGDARESAGAAVADRLLAMGANVCACDPHVVEPVVDERVTRVDLTEEELSSADAVVLLVDHDVFDYGLVERRARLVLDTRHRLHGPRRRDSLGGIGPARPLALGAAGRQSESRRRGPSSYTGPT